MPRPFLRCAVCLPACRHTAASLCAPSPISARAPNCRRRVYYDFADMLRTNPSGNVPYTPILPLLYGMEASLKLLAEEGMPNVAARHHRCGPRCSLFCGVLHFESKGIEQPDTVVCMLVLAPYSLGGCHLTS